MQQITGTTEGKSALMRILKCEGKELNEREEKKYKTSLSNHLNFNFHLYFLIISSLRSDFENFGRI